QSRVHAMRGALQSRSHSGFCSTWPRAFIKSARIEAQVSSRVAIMRFVAIGVFLLCAAAVGAVPVATTSSSAHNSGATPTPIPRPTPHPRPLPPITVTNTKDSGSRSLRQALADSSDGDLINFAAALEGQTVTLTSGELVIDKNVTIEGPGPNT